MSNQNEDYDEELAKAAECKKKACKKFKAMTMKAGKKRKRAAASFFLPLPMYSRIWRSLFLPLIFLQLAKKDPDVLLRLPRPLLRLPLLKAKVTLKTLSMAMAVADGARVSLASTAPRLSSLILFRPTLS